MKTEDQCIISLTRWFRNNTVGNIIFYHAPNADMADCILEEVIKAREKPQTVSGIYVSV